MKSDPSSDGSDQAMALISAFDGALLGRYQWMLKALHAMALGERPTFPHMPDDILREPGGDSGYGDDERESASQRLESQWQDVVYAASPVSGHDGHEQIRDFYGKAERFMQSGEESRQRVWRSLALCDALTGAATRLSLKHRLLKERERACRLGMSCVLVLLDHDGFKQVNDCWGHAAGDEVLVQTAALMRQLLRSSDLVFRYGGDEWLVLLPATDLSAAQASAERLQQAIAEQQFHSADGQKFGSRVTFGLAESIPGESPQAWISRADRQMYRSKAERRNDDETGTCSPGTGHRIADTYRD